MKDEFIGTMKKTTSHGPSKKKHDIDLIILTWLKNTNNFHFLIFDCQPNSPSTSTTHQLQHANCPNFSNKRKIKIRNFFLMFLQLYKSEIPCMWQFDYQFDFYPTTMEFLYNFFFFFTTNGIGRFELVNS